MSDDRKSIADAFTEREQLTRQVNAASGKEGSESQSIEVDGGWDELSSGNKAQKEAILKEHFLKALERFNAGVSLSKIRQHYEKLGAKYSPVTFRKKWDELVRAHAEHG
ncbi:MULTISPECIES: hypothetical protein [Burkholderia]|uniref:hypothetical protein n=1 Tax=Burkholderia TaxID=32008 RepID=UPI00097C7892|nr:MULTISPECIES: hypothetical protein [Burkholderia]AQQ48473.1 hypothetical protein A8F32_21735 [Burkholderia cenocepacia]MBA9900736.1 hypothetical protein [Burkholderia cepacia]MBA9947705.1 hypothetical protein [Burkholderia cepacia]MBA9977833.1 hypothetical protein [Burkholderia cepacia]MBA9996700.1 hypothetical protein [Burkholderia cepacia]